MPYRNGLSYSLGSGFLVVRGVRRVILGDRFGRRFHRGRLLVSTKKRFKVEKLQHQQHGYNRWHTAAAGLAAAFGAGSSSLLESLEEAAFFAGGATLGLAARFFATAAATLGFCTTSSSLEESSDDDAGLGCLGIEPVKLTCQIVPLRTRFVAWRHRLPSAT